MNPASQPPLFLCGDVMTGRGVDQILAHPSQPWLHESHVHSAIDYVRLAERKSGPIARPVAPAYPWGEALAELDRRAAQPRIANLETAITTSDDAWPGKAVHYRMHPRNIACLQAAGIDCAILANNHVLDWGRAGLADTLDALDRAHIAHAGAGADDASAACAAVLPRPGGGRVVVLAFAMPNAGTPAAWRATAGHPGVNLLDDWSAASQRRIAAQAGQLRRPGDVVVLSIHWGPNWGYDIDPAQRAFAHALIDHAGIDIVHGHSSHHPLGIEVHAGKPILYGCGDFINDYEGIGGYESYRPELGLMVFVSFDGGGSADLRLVPMRRCRFRLAHAREAEMSWLQAMFATQGRALGTRVARTAAHELRLWAA
ncbi:CapA family protein [Cupriavidus necator]|uniref:CapA family protein n=1 Tax=Cupriavidus necator TaxID=106590 RepID=UPI0014906134|nr:CapA family protein [Cupriavidus necator]NOV25751.1 CapA family protein [Cupriavidus necator]